MSWKDVPDTIRSVYSEETNSTFDEERTRRIFDACDANGDGYIDSKDLATICEDLNLDGCIEGLMQELGADENGKISYDQFLKAQMFLRPKIKALKFKCASGCSVNSAGKCDYWEYDSGVRDLNSEQNTTVHCIIGDNFGDGTNSENLLQMANKLHLAAIASLQEEKTDLIKQLYEVTDERNLLEDYFNQVKINPEHAVAQKYEEQITELRSVIAILRQKLNTKNSCIIVEEDNEQSIHDFDDDIIDLKDEATSPVIFRTRNVGVNVRLSDDDVKELERINKIQNERIIKLTGDLKTTKMCLREAYNRINTLEDKLQENDNLQECQECNAAAETRDTSNCGCIAAKSPIPKIAQKVKVQKLDSRAVVTGRDISKVGVSHTEVAEHLVSKLQDECYAQELLNQKGRKQIQLKVEEMRAKEEYLRAQNTLLQSNFEEMKNNCERIYLLLGKYESKSVALKLVVDMCYELIADYEQLVCVLMNHRRLDTPVSEEEKHIRSAIASLKKQWGKLQPTVVELESYHNVDIPGKIKPTYNEKNIMDLETAVLIQDLTEMRKQNAKLKMTVHEMTHEFGIIERKVIILEDKLQVIHNCPSSNSDAKTITVLPEKLKDVSVMLENIIQKIDLDHRQSTENMERLRKIAVSMMKNFDEYRINSEHQLYRLEDNIMYFKTKHAAQINDLWKRITLLEELAEEKLDNRLPIHNNFIESSRNTHYDSVLSSTLFVGSKSLNLRF